MKIGELASATETAVETIRYYEREGLLPEPVRTSSNYRRYEPAHLERLLLIRHCRALDMSLEEVRALLGIFDGHTAQCDEVNALLRRHLGHVQARISALAQLEGQLQSLLARCTESTSLDACAMVQDLASGDRWSAPAASGTDGCGHGEGVHGRRPAKPGGTA